MSVRKSDYCRALGLSLGLYVLWTGATYLLEGWPLTLLRPEAVALRVAYAVLANMLIGTLGALWVSRRLVGSGMLRLEQTGFRRAQQIAISLGAGALLGLGAYFLQGAPSRVPLVILNGFSQTLPVSIAEVLVCWTVIGGSTEAAARPRGHASATVAAIVVTSALFACYHIAHSPPFNTLTMIFLLSGVGVATSIFFFISRDIYGTIIFHNFLAAFGVIQALAAADGFAGYAEAKVPLYIMAVIAMLVLVIADLLWLRGRRG